MTWQPQVGEVVRVVRVVEGREVVTPTRVARAEHHRGRLMAVGVEAFTGWWSCRDDGRWRIDGCDVFEMRRAEAGDVETVDCVDLNHAKVGTSAAQDALIRKLIREFDWLNLSGEALVRVADAMGIDWRAK